MTATTHAKYLVDTLDFVGRTMAEPIQGFYPTISTFERPWMSNNYLLRLQVDGIYVHRELTDIHRVMYSRTAFSMFIKELVQGMVLEALDLWAFGPVTR
jgi:hypothetical protein